MDRAEFANTHLLGEVDKLLADEEPTVRSVALETLCDMIPLLDEGDCLFKFLCIL